MRLSKIVASAAVAGGVAAGMGLAAATANAEPAPPPAPGQPAWANGSPQVWDQGWQRWGVWLNGIFVPTF
ncbi:hypothetical protein ACQI4L_26100 [Mycolicibacterium litorale]|uniref:hypothetical protein n=1 Tax=Mycolicibacterium litorale TaxID=758802 RepID=UPI003CE6A921